MNIDLDKLAQDRELIIKAFNENKISEEYYVKRIIEIDEQIEKLKAKEIKNNINQNIISNPTLKFDGEHFETTLFCPKCNNTDTVSYKHQGFRMLGKDKQGFIFFECPNCKTHLKWDSLTGKIKSNKGLLGFLFNKFS